MKKRILPALLALCMVASLLPVAVFAAAADHDFTADVAYACDCKKHGEDGKSACSGTVTVKNVALKANYDADSASEEDIAAAKDAAIKVEAAKGKQGLCDDCKASADCNPCEDESCANEKKHAATSDEHIWLCACAGEESKCTSASHDAEKSDKCQNQVDNKGDICAACQASIKAAEDAEAEANRDCRAAGDGVEAVTGTENCQNPTHQADCPAKCNVGDCTLTKGHSGDHNNKTCLKGLPGCNPDVKEHDEQCEHYVVPEADPGTGNARDYIEVEVEVECACEDAEHDHTNAGHTAKVKATVKYYFTYDWPLADESGKVYTAAELDVIKAESLKAAQANAKTEAAKEATKAELVKLVSEEDATCDFCKAANKAADKAADEKHAENQMKCTMAFDCNAGPDAKDHKENCLSLCTMDSNCGNSVGVSTAHKVQYQVYVTTYTVTLNKDDEIVRSVLRVSAAATGPKYDTLAEAQAYRASLPERGTIDTDDVAYGYSIRSLHCPKAGVPNGVVVNEEGTVVAPPEENTTDTPKAPEKAADFDDLKGDEWYAEELTAALEKGFFKGSLDAGKYSFKATDKMNTSTLVVLVSRVLDKGFKTEGADWDKEAVAWAAEDGLTEGIEAGEVTRKDVVLVLWRAAGKPASEQDVSAFTDLADLEGDELTAMKWAVEKEIIKGDAGETKTARPADSITRAEMVAVVNRFDGVVNKK